MKAELPLNLVWVLFGAMLSTKSDLTSRIQSVPTTGNRITGMRWLWTLWICIWPQPMIINTIYLCEKQKLCHNCRNPNHISRKKNRRNSPQTRFLSLSVTFWQSEAGLLVSSFNRNNAFQVVLRKSSLHSAWSLYATDNIRQPRIQDIQGSPSMAIFSIIRS